MDFFVGLKFVFILYLIVPPSTTVAKVNLPAGMPGNNVLLPLGNLLQLLPSTSSATSATPINAAQMPRHLIPPMPSSLLGQRTVGYIVTPNSGVTNSIGGRGIAVPNLMTNPNQRLQTFFVKVTNPAATNSMNSVINSTPRLPTAPQTSYASSAPGTSGLVLLSHTPRHPAPFPVMPPYPANPNYKGLPPKPSLKGSKAPNGINLSWNMALTKEHADIASYQLFAYQETSAPISAALWKRVGNVKALPLPMACTLTQFANNQRYHFTIRAVDIHNRYGPFSDPVNVFYSVNK